MLIILKYTLIQQSKGTSQLLVVFWAHKLKKPHYQKHKRIKKERLIFFAILVFFETKKESPEGLPFPLLSNTIILV